MYLFKSLKDKEKKQMFFHQAPFLYVGSLFFFKQVCWINTSTE